MIDVQLHLRGQQSRERQFAMVPHAGDVVDLDGQLWRVAAIVHQADGALHVYAVQVADTSADELRAEWGSWDKVAAADPEPATAEQTELFR